MKVEYAIKYNVHVILEGFRVAEFNFNVEFTLT